MTVLQLTNKDVIAAEDTYIQEHLPKSGYASSKEAEIVDSLISAFRSTDEGQLQDVRAPQPSTWTERSRTWC